MPLAVRDLEAGSPSVAAPVASHPPSSSLTLNFSLPLHDTAALEELIQTESVTHRYPTRAELYARFAPPSAQTEALESWLTSRGYTITHVSAEGTSVAASAPTATVERTLATRVEDYVRHPYSYQGVKVPRYRFYANTAAPQVPARLGLAAISGLSDVDRFFTDAELAGEGEAGSEGALTRSGSGYYPQDLRSMYDVAGHGVDASGQTIGFTLWGAGETQAAMTKFATSTGDTPIAVDTPCLATTLITRSTCRTAQPSPNHLLSVLENGNANGASGNFEFAGDVETALDIEQAHGMAPGAAMKYYLGDCTPSPPAGSGLTNATCNGTDVGLEEAVEDAAADPTLHTVSDSWGYGGDPEWGSADPFRLATESSFELAAAAGTTFWFSTGDDGTYQSGYPADSPYVVSVGGTSDFSTANLASGNTSETAQRSTQTAWAAGGSWCSSLEPRPSWQSGPGVSANAGCPGRAVPDVSAIADTNTAVYVAYTSGLTAGTPQLQSGSVGGTSVAAPEMNGMEAMTESFLEGQSYQGPAPDIGFEGPTLYELGNSAHSDGYFRDVLCGNTANPSGGPDGDAAGPGWDPATGWGEIDWWNYSTGYALALGATGLSEPGSLDPGYAFGCARTPTNATERAVSMPTEGVGYAVGSPSSSTPWPARLLASNAWGASNNFLKTTDGGATWQTTNSDMMGIACTSATSCIEVGDGGRIRRTADGGATWSYVESPFDKALTGVACPSASVCYAAGDRGALLKSGDGGLSWSFLPSADGSPLYGLSCPSTAVCYAVDEYAHVEKTTDGGAHWALQATPVTTPGEDVPGSGGPNPFAGLFGISCSGVETCVAVGGFPPTGTDPPILTTSNGGATWTLRTSNAGANNDLNGVACVGLQCYAVGRGGAIVTSADGGATWSAMTSNTAVQLTGIACASATSCVASGQSGTVDVLSGGTWTPTASLAGANFLAAVTCTSATSCVAAGKQGATLGFNPSDVAGTATLQAGGGTTQQMNAISCVDAQHCVTVGNAGTVLTTADAGQTWLARTSGTTANLAGVSCAGASCEAVGAVSGGAATILASNDGGASWTAQTSGLTTALSGVACTSATACVAVGVSGKILTTTDSGATWTPAASGTTTNLNAVACRATDCYAAGAILAPATTATILVSNDGGASWSAQSSNAPQALASIACVSDVACFAAGALGTVVSTTDGGISWAQQGNPISGPVNALNAGPTGITAINGAACSSARCVFGTASAGDIMTTPLLTVSVHAHGAPGAVPALSGLSPSDPAISYTPAGQAGNVTGTLTCTTEATTASPAGSYSLSGCGGLSAPGYSVVYDLDDSSYRVEAAGGSGGGAAPPGQGPATPGPRPQVKVLRSPTSRHGGKRKGGPPYTFAFAGSPPGVVFYCRLDKGKWKRCASPVVYRHLKRGRHVFKIKSVDAAGRESAVRTVKFFAGKRRG